MRVRIYELFFLLSFISILDVAASAQVDWNIYTEGGVFHSTNNLSSKSSDMLFRVDGNLRYLYTESDYSASVKLRLRPELYGLNNNFNSIKFKASGDYYKKEDIITWGVKLIGQKNFYQNKITDFNYSIFAFSLSADWLQFENNPISIQLGYAYQTASENIEQNLDLIFWDMKFFNSSFLHSNLVYGFYAEKFSIENKYLTVFNRLGCKNKGWRFGPQISFAYQNQAIFHIEYRFLIHSSGVTKYPSYEHWVRLVAGKLFLDDWSIFLLADYYNRHFTLRDNNLSESNLIYNPLDIENRINLKIAYEIKNGFELYFKSGYFKENFFDQQFNFDGWNILVGFEITN